MNSVFVSHERFPIEPKGLFHLSIVNIVKGQRSGKLTFEWTLMFCVSVFDHYSKVRMSDLMYISICLVLFDSVVG